MSAVKPIVFKILTAGEGGVGKTTLLRRFVEGRFMADTKMTIGVEFFLKALTIKNKNILLQLWDFGGQERFRFILQSYVRGARGALLMFDLTRPMTLNNLDQWVDICRSEDSKLPILFIGTKADLEKEIAVDEEIIVECKEKFGLLDYVKISSKTGENVNKAFQILSNEIFRRVFK